MSDNKEKLLLAIKINDNVVDRSTNMDDKTKQAFWNLSKYATDFLESESKITSYGLNSLKSGLLTYWNESINPDTEIFWAELKANSIDYERKEPLRFALDKNRFKGVEQGIEARKHWNELKRLKVIQDNFSLTEIKKIDSIIASDENTRLEILRKCLRKKEIPQTQYLKFGECMAYMGNCGLFEKYFRKDEVEDLYAIWKNFESK